MRPYKDIIHPMLYDYANRVAQVGFNTFDQFEISYLNDFITYLNEIVPHGNFAFYPLRRKQNVGQGRTGIGMGKMGSGNPIVFTSDATWGASGVYMDGTNSCGLIDFENLKFQFRRDRSTIFYVFKHERNENEELMFRPSQKTPYFCFDRSDNICADHFTIYAPEFSNDPRRPIGTTYIYDEIFGLDKKGYSVDYSLRPSEIVSKNEAYSFYSLEDNFVSLNFCSDFNNFSLRSFSGVDNTILTGSFPRPYLVRYEKELDEQLTGTYAANPNYNPNDPNPDPSETNPGSSYVNEPEGELVKKFLMPSRMVIGAGVSNTSNSYNVSGLPQTCAGVLIISGDYCNILEEINLRLFQALDVQRRPSTFLQKNTEKIQIGGNISSIIYKDNPFQLDQISDKFLFIPSIEKTVYRSIFDFYYELIGNTGSLLAPAERFYTSGLVNAMVYIALTDSFTGSHTGQYGVTTIEAINKGFLYHPQETGGIYGASGIEAINKGFLYQQETGGIYSASGIEVINKDFLYQRETGGIYGASGIEKINWGLPALFSEQFNLSASGFLDDINTDRFDLSASGFMSDVFYLDTGTFGGASGISSIDFNLQVDTGTFGGASGISSIDFNLQVDTGTFGGASGIELIIAGPTGFQETMSLTSSGNIGIENVEILSIIASGNIIPENLEIFGLTASGSISVI